MRKRFGNKQLIINKHMEQLLNTEGVSSQHDVKSLSAYAAVVYLQIESEDGIYMRLAVINHWTGLDWTEVCFLFSNIAIKFFFY